MYILQLSLLLLTQKISNILFNFKRNKTIIKKKKKKERVKSNLKAKKQRNSKHSSKIEHNLISTQAI